MASATEPSKADASEGVNKLLAQARGDHGHWPVGAVFHDSPGSREDPVSRLHSDKGGELPMAGLESWVAGRGVRRATTAGYGPPADGAGEAAVGYLTRHASFLLPGRGSTPSGGVSRC